LNGKNVHLDLFHAFTEGDEDAFGKIYRLYFPRLYAFSNKIINDSNLAKDVVQTVFIRMWESPSLFRVERPEGFLFQMVRNASLNYIRHLKVVENFKSKVKDHYMGEALYYIDMAGNEPCILIEKELERKILEVMNALPEKCLDVFRMSRIDGLKNREIAEKLGLSIKSVEKHISKALQVFRDRFSGYLPLQIILLVLNGLK